MPDELVSCLLDAVKANLTPVTLRQDPVYGKLPPLLQVHPADSVAVALRPLLPGEPGLGLSVAGAIPQGHKVALVALAAGDRVIKYGQPIGRATRAIAPGEHVHSHNLTTALEGELVYRQTRPAPTGQVPGTLPGWRGYLRSDGRAATRNEI